VFESIESPRELFTYQLGAALTMETTVLDMLGQLETAAQRAELKEQLRHHVQEDGAADPEPGAGVPGDRRRGRRQAVPGDRGHREGKPGAGQERAEDSLGSAAATPVPRLETPPSAKTQGASEARMEVPHECLRCANILAKRKSVRATLYALVSSTLVPSQAGERVLSIVVELAGR
jgi:Domain of unknown function (DUF892)